MKTKNYISRYNSVAEFSATLHGEPLENDNTFMWNNCTWKNVSGYKSFTEIEELLVNGDFANAQKITAAGEITPPPISVTPQLRSAVVGCIPNVPNYLRGVPTSMYQIKSNKRQRPIINIYIDCGVHDYVDTKKLAEKSNYLANAIAATELVGYRVNLFALCVGQNSAKQKYGFSLNIKEADAPLNVLNIAFPLLNKAFCRGSFFRWADVNVPFKTNWGSTSYGRTLAENETKEAFAIKDNEILIKLSSLADYDRSQSYILGLINGKLTQN